MVKVAQQEKHLYRTHYEQCYANTIRSLDTGIGDRHHVRDGNSLRQISDRRAPKKRPRLRGGATFVAQLNDVRLASEPGHWCGAKADAERRTGRQGSAGPAGLELTAEVPQAI
jgi:hypothetical protein